MCKHKWKTINRIGKDRIRECKLCGAKKRIIPSKFLRRFKKS